MRLMALMAHPDDAEIWCGGTLILNAERGNDVLICILSYTEDSERGLEAEKGAAQMGCSLELLGMEDVGIRDTAESASRLWRSVESFGPDTIITHWIDDMHPDHEATFRLLRRSLLLGYLKKWKDDLQAFPRIFCCDNMGSIGLHGPFKPDQYVDVNPFWQKKIDAINAHRSQPLWYYLDMIDKQCAEHGQASGKKRAEAFLYVPFLGFNDTGPQLGTD
jgi:LmbE family N-acetylglucosaminyl deacetylase